MSAQLLEVGSLCSQDAQFLATPCLLQAGRQGASGPRSSPAKGALCSLRHGCLHKPTHYVAASSQQAERTSKTVGETSQSPVKTALGSDSPVVSCHICSFKTLARPTLRGSYTGLLSRKQRLCCLIWVCLFIWYVFVEACVNAGAQMLWLSESWSSAISWVQAASLHT